MKKLLAFLVLVGGIAGYLWFARGPVGRAVGFARTWAAPRDPGLLAFLPADSVGVVVGHVPFARLPDHATLRAELERQRLHWVDYAGVDLVMDVDAAAGNGRVLVLRGRFSWGDLVEHLARDGFTLDEGGVTPVLRKGAQTVAHVRPYLVMGASEPLQRALADQRAGTGLASNPAMMSLLDEAGWRSAVLAAARADETVGALVPAANKVRSARASLTSWISDFRVRAALKMPAEADGRALESTLRDGRAALVRELRRADNRHAQLVAQALEDATLEYDANAMLLRGDLAVPMEAFGDGVEQAAQDVGAAALASRFPSLDQPAPAAPKPSAPVPGPGPSDAELLQLNALVKELCAARGPACSLQQRSDMLNAAVRLRAEGRELDAIRAALSTANAPPGEAPPVGRGIGVESADLSTGCGGDEEDLLHVVESACNGRKLCRYEVDPGAAGTASPGCRRAFRASWRCADGKEVYEAAVHVAPGRKTPVTLLCD